jgi:amylosucrase
MGDEIGLTNDHDYESDPNLAHDGRWMHRPMMDWSRAARRHETGSIENRIYTGLRRIIEKRRATPQIHAANPIDVLDLGADGTFAFARPSPTGSLVCVFNFSEQWRSIDAARLSQAGVTQWYDLLGEAQVYPQDGSIALPPQGRVWLT